MRLAPAFLALLGALAWGVLTDMRGEVVPSHPQATDAGRR